MAVPTQKIKNSKEIYSWGIINKNPDNSTVLLDPITKETLLSSNERYPEIFYLFQDQHISDHRKFYDQYSEDMISFNHWHSINISVIDRFYLLVLLERFEPERHVAITLDIWYKAFKKYADIYIGKCNICGVYKLGSCREKPYEEPILLEFDY